jgi:hypothetical protein
MLKQAPIVVGEIPKIGGANVGIDWVGKQSSRNLGPAAAGAGSRAGETGLRDPGRR